MKVGSLKVRLIASWSALLVAITPTIIRAADSAPFDPEDRAALEAVCGNCHALSLFLDSPRSATAWRETLQKMAALGATGSDEQLRRVIVYLRRNLTLLNINTAPPEEIARVLGISESAAQAVAAKRVERKFSSLEDLRGLPDVDIELLEQRRGLIVF